MLLYTKAGESAAAGVLKRRGDATTPEDGVSRNRAGEGFGNAGLGEERRSTGAEADRDPAHAQTSVGETTEPGSGVDERGCEVQHDRLADEIARRARQRGVNAPAGTEFLYNNGAYNLLGSIVKRISGQSLRAFAESNIFRPLGMTHTQIRDDPGLLIPDRAAGYTRDAMFGRTIDLYEELLFPEPTAVSERERLPIVA